MESYSKHLWFERTWFIHKGYYNNNNNGRKISAVSGDDRDSTFLFQRISVLIQRHNFILLRQTGQSF